MSTISRIKTWATSDTLTAADLNAEFNNIMNDYNGSITNANISGSAAITYSKLSLSLSILNADVSATAEIAATKIAGTAAALSATQTFAGVITFGAATKQTLTTDSDSATIAFDLDVSNLHQVTMAGNRTLEIANEDAGQVFIIKIIQDGTGSRTVTWFDTINWTNGTAPTLTETADKADVFGFICTAADTYDGFIVGQNIGT